MLAHELQRTSVSLGIFLFKSYNDIATAQGHGSVLSRCVKRPSSPIISFFKHVLCEELRTDPSFTKLKHKTIQKRIITMPSTSVPVECLPSVVGFSCGSSGDRKKSFPRHTHCNTACVPARDATSTAYQWCER